jgi:hypothetical protein
MGATIAYHGQGVSAAHICAVVLNAWLQDVRWLRRCCCAVIGERATSSCGAFSPTRKRVGLVFFANVDDRQSIHLRPRLNCVPSTSTMFARCAPHAAARASRSAQCSAPQASTALPARTWRPVRQPFGRRHNSTMGDQVKAQFRRSPVLFPFAVVR